MRRPCADSRTAAARPASPAPMMWTVPVSDEGITQRDPDQLCLADAHALARQRKAACDHAVENAAIGRAHDARRLHRAARAARHDRFGLFEMLARALHDDVAGDAEIGMR